MADVTRREQSCSSWRCFWAFLASCRSAARGVTEVEEASAGCNADVVSRDGRLGTSARLTVLLFKEARQCPRQFPTTAETKLVMSCASTRDDASCAADRTKDEIAEGVDRVKDGVGDVANKVSDAVEDMFPSDSDRDGH